MAATTIVIYHPRPLLSILSHLVPTSPAANNEQDPAHITRPSIECTPTSSYHHSFHFLRLPVVSLMIVVHDAARSHINNI